MSFAAMVPQDEVAADFPNETTPETPPLGPGQLETTRQFTTKEMSKVGSSPPEATSKNGEIATPEPPETAVAGHTSTAVIHTTHRTVSEVIVPQTQTPAATSVATVSTTQKSNGVSTGAVAGIAIGTCILGAAIALVVAFLIFKRRKRSSTSGLSAYGSTPELVALSKGPTPFVQEISQVSAPNVAAAVTVKRDMDLTDLSNSSDFLAGVLPQTADDQAVRSKVSMLFNQIQQHVENFYRDVHASITPSMESDLTRFGTPGIDMMELLQSASMPTVAIKHALMGYVLRISSPEGDEATLFPGDVTGVGGKKQFGTPDLSAAYILYKRLAVHLHTAVQSNAQGRLSDIREAAEHFALTFFPWANPAYGDQEKDEDLVQLISSALDLSIWLYGQPFIYEFLWESVGRRGVVVSPGLAKLTDSKGRIDEQRQILLEPVVVSA